jgi:hypothetical protein
MDCNFNHFNFNYLCNLAKYRFWNSLRMTVAYPGIFSEGGRITPGYFSEGVQQIQLTIEGRENRDLGAVVL